MPFGEELVGQVQVLAVYHLVDDAPLGGLVFLGSHRTSSSLKKRAGERHVSGCRDAAHRSDGILRLRLAHYMKLTRKEPKHMATLQELLDLEGVVVAGEFDFEGRMLDYEAKMDMPEEMAQMAAQFCAAVSVMLNTMASSFADRSGMNWVPQHGWAYSGGEWTACIGDGGKRGVFVETSKADFNRLFGALGEDR